MAETTLYFYDQYADRFLSWLMLWGSAGKSNISPEGQNGPDNDSNPVHWTASCEGVHRFWTFNF